MRRFAASACRKNSVDEEDVGENVDVILIGQRVRTIAIEFVRYIGNNRIRSKAHDGNRIYFA